MEVYSASKKNYIVPVIKKKPASNLQSKHSFTFSAVKGQQRITLTYSQRFRSKCHVLCL